MSRSMWIRQIHRWVAMTFVISSIVTAIVLFQPEPAEWVAYVPLFPLAFLLVSGLYLFVLPYTTRARAAQR
ncbi:hypothetical protein [Pseudonocardia sp. TRM90224]|uniref:hypothetical protein n=1 Tax=Pseudonocardia sp. TRM90224 TaxID=2812678 RepID=UPI001E51BE47|nr:hypothetical protein [Pseudonocardia sp. TRM90224]